MTVSESRTVTAHEIFNTNEVKIKIVYSMSVSDVIDIVEGDKHTGYFVDSFGFTEIPDWNQDKNLDNELTSGQIVQKLDGELRKSTKAEIEECKAEAMNRNDNASKKKDKDINADVILK